MDVKKDTNARVYHERDRWGAKERETLAQVREGFQNFIMFLSFLKPLREKA